MKVIESKVIESSWWLLFVEPYLLRVAIMTSFVLLGQYLAN